MNPFVWNCILAFAWVAFTGQFSGTNLAAGFGLGAVILTIAQRAIGSPAYVARLRSVGNLLLFFLWELVKANLRVAYDVLTHRHHMRPGIVAIPLDAQTDFEITLLATLITLTPGSLSVDVSDDRQMLYVHDMYISDPEGVRHHIKFGYERRVLKVLR